MLNENNPVIQAAMNYQRESAQYVTMRQLGTTLGVSSHVVGRKLKQIGLREEDGQPSAKAREGGFTKLIRCQETFLLDLWNQDKTLTVLRPLLEQKQ